jgi:hypothetical protein
MKTSWYIRDKENRKKGILVSTVKDGVFGIGFSLCATSRGDKFDKELAKKIATIRSDKMIEENEAHIVPHSIENEFSYFFHECVRYYRESAVPAEWLEEYFDGISISELNEICD